MMNAQMTCWHALLCWLMCTLLTGCAVLPDPPAGSVREDWGTLVVAPARYPPRSNIRSFAVGKGAGAAKGAAAGSAAGLAGSGAFAASGALQAVLAPYLAVIMVPVMGTVGAYRGSQVALTEQDAAALDAQIQHNLDALQVPAVLARSIVDTAELDTGRRLPLLAEAGPATPEQAPDYRALAQQGADSVLEVIATETGFTGGKQLSFYLIATIRVVRVTDGSQLYEREFVYQSEDYAGVLWGKNQATLFQSELQRAYASLADSVVEQLFLLTPLPLHSHAGVAGETGLQELLVGRDACGLAWASPERDIHFDFRDEHLSNLNRFPMVDNRRPTLAWESFPRETDKQAEGRTGLAGISKVRYDLRVWRARADVPPGLVYERRDLAVPYHTLEIALSPGSRYFWSARARFEEGGRVHGTKWGYFRTPGYESRGKVKPDTSPAVVLGVITGTGAAPRDACTLDFIPISNYYRFQTP